jgi:hypothetical protein
VDIPAAQTIARQVIIRVKLRDLGERISRMIQ